MLLHLFKAEKTQTQRIDNNISKTKRFLNNWWDLPAKCRLSKNQQVHEKAANTWLLFSRSTVEFNGY